jgi:osmotically-inducible protein OsmY
LTGVRGVRNDIEVRSNADRADILLHVQDALDRSALVPDDSDVTVSADQSIVTLDGHVRTWAEHDAVIDAAWRAIGVQEVRDNLSITG